MKNILFFTFFLLPLLLLGGGRGWSQIITTIAGSSDTALGDGGPAINASLNGPYAVALDGKGNYYISDGYHNRIRKVNSSGIITTIAGTGVQGYNGDGIPATAAQLYFPVGITFDHVGNLYFCDAGNNRVRKIDTFGIITTVAGNGNSVYNGDNIQADSAALYNPHCVAVDVFGNLYITEWGNHRVRKVKTLGIITTIAGTGVVGYTGDNGAADTAKINTPYGIVLDDTGNIYFSDAYENVVRKIDTSGIITTFAGGAAVLGDNGPADSAELTNPAGLAIDGNGNIYIADVYDNMIRKVTVESGIITTVAGNGMEGFSGDNGPAINAELNVPTGIAIDAVGDLYCADFGNDRIRFITSTLSVNNLNNTVTNIAIYPNPSYSGAFTICATSGLSEQAGIIITNVLGQKIKECNIPTNKLQDIQLDVPAGIYTITAVTKEDIQSKQLVIVY